MSELERLSPRRVLEYAGACLTRDALLLAREIDLAMLSAELLAGGGRTFQRLQRQVRGMLGVTAAATTFDPQEQTAIAEVEREIAAQFPFYRDPRRLKEIHDAIGLMRLKL